MHNIDEPALDSTERQGRRPQSYLSLAGMLMLVTALAMVFWVGTNWKRYLGFAEAVLICAIPFSVVIEAAFGKYPRREGLGTRVELLRAGLLVLASILPAAVVQYIVHRSPLQRVGPALTLSWRNGLEAWSINDSYLIGVPAAAVFLVLAAPVISQRHINRLPLRSLMVLLLYTIMSTLILFNDYASILPVHVISAILIFGLWSTWLSMRCQFTAINIVIWDAALSIWLFGFAFPV